MFFKTLLPIAKVGGSKLDLSNDVIDRMRRVNDQSDLSDGKLRIINSIEEANEETLVVPVGGDGTLVHAAKLAVTKGSHVLGINLGKVGFLTDETADDMHEFILKVKSGHFVEVDQRILLSVQHDGKTYIALNDFVISDLYSDSIINYDLKIGRNDAGNHTANSVIIATPTGSTAYPMSVGGPIIDPQLSVFEIIPVAALSMATRPIIVWGGHQVTVRVNLKKDRIVSFKADGRECARIVGKSDNDAANITITRHDEMVKFVHADKWNFFEKMSNKMGWNKQ